MLSMGSGGVAGFCGPSPAPLSTVRQDSCSTSWVRAKELRAASGLFYKSLPQIDSGCSRIRNSRHVRSGSEQNLVPISSPVATGHCPKLDLPQAIFRVRSLEFRFAVILVLSSSVLSCALQVFNIGLGSSALFAMLPCERPWRVKPKLFSLVPI